MNHELNQAQAESETQESADDQLVVEIPTEIRAGLSRVEDYNCHLILA